MPFQRSPHLPHRLKFFFPLESTTSTSMRSITSNAKLRKALFRSTILGGYQAWSGQCALAISSQSLDLLYLSVRYLERAVPGWLPCAQTWWGSLPIYDSLKTFGLPTRSSLIQNVKCIQDHRDNQLFQCKLASVSNAVLYSSSGNVRRSGSLDPAYTLSTFLWSPIMPKNDSR